MRRQEPRREGARVNTFATAPDTHRTTTGLLMLWGRAREPLPPGASKVAFKQPFSFPHLFWLSSSPPLLLQEVGGNSETNPVLPHTPDCKSHEGGAVCFSVWSPLHVGQHLTWNKHWNPFICTTNIYGSSTEWGTVLVLWLHHHTKESKIPVFPKFIFRQVEWGSNGDGSRWTINIIYE